MVVTTPYNTTYKDAVRDIVALRSDDLSDFDLFMGSKSFRTIDRVVADDDPDEIFKAIQLAQKQAEWYSAHPAPSAEPRWKINGLGNVDMPGPNFDDEPILI